MIKRLFDITFSVSGLILFLPLFAFIGLIIWFSMPGPVFFSQTRIGYKGKPFTIYKFRTMVVNTGSVVITIESDHRITTFGKFLRNSKLDELPQLWNILTGEMSFVGPRPDVPGYYDQLTGEDRIILGVKPGLTGADSVAYSHEEAILQQQDDPEKFYNEKLFPDKVRINREYVRHRSFLLDLKILLLTLLGRHLSDEKYKPRYSKSLNANPKGKMIGQ